MTKKDYIWAVSVIKNYQEKHPAGLVKHIINAFVDFFIADNHRFDEKRFRKACDN